MKSLKGKKILILGGTAPCVHVTRFAKEMGAYVYVADEKTEKLYLSQKEQLEIGYGLEVMKVNAGKMKDAGVAKGFIIRQVNDQPMKTVDDLQTVVKEASTSKEPVLYIKGLYPTGKPGYFAIDLQGK